MSPTTLNEAMQFNQFFTPTSVIPNLTSKNKLDAIEELVTTLRKNRRIADADAVMERVLEREALDSTGIGHGVALPHARIPTLNRIVCGIARHPLGLDFDSIDRAPVKLIFLILYPPTEASRYLFLISTLTRMLLHDGLAERLLVAPDNAVLEELLSASENYVENHEADEVVAVGATPLPPTTLNPDIARLIRLQRLEDQRPTGARTNTALEEKIAHVRSCISGRLINRYDKLRRRGGPAIVASEGGICQGCHMQFSTSFVQELRSKAKLATCPSCARFLYVIS